METENKCRIGRLLEFLLDLLQEFVIIPSYISVKSRLCIMSMFTVLCCTAAKRREPCQIHRRRKTTPPTNGASIVFAEYVGNKRSPTKNCWNELVSPLCTPHSANTGFSGLIMFWGLATSASEKKICCTVAKVTSEN